MIKQSNIFIQEYEQIKTINFTTSFILYFKLSPNLAIFTDKTSNIYKAPPQEFNKLLKDIITKSYKKSTDRLEKAINRRKTSPKTPTK